MTQQAEYIITLVHGTWVRSAKWTLQDSPFRRALEERLQPALVQFSVFNWSGSNDLGARRQAAAALLRHLRHLVRTHPQAGHYVISHSHGGNISMLALRRMQQHLKGLVCLSTPFIHVQQRRFPVDTKEAFEFGVAAWAFLGWLSLLRFLSIGNKMLFHWHDNPVTARAILSLALALVLVVILDRALKKWTKMIPRALRRFRLPEINTDRMLIIRAAGDEATAVLGLARLWSWFLTKAIAYATKFGKRKWGWKPVLAVLGSVVSLFAGAWLSDELHSDWPLAYAFPLCFLLLLIGAIEVWGETIAAAFVAPVCVLLAIIMRLAYGREATLFGAAIEITAEPTPPGAWSSVTVDSDDGFAHSSYEAPAVRLIVGDWISRRWAGVTQRR